MNFLDKTGLINLWSKIKDLMSGYLPLTGGTINGDLVITRNGSLTIPDSIKIAEGSAAKTYNINVNKCVELGILEEDVQIG